AAAGSLRHAGSEHSTAVSPPSVSWNSGWSPSSYTFRPPERGASAPSDSSVNVTMLGSTVALVSVVSDGDEVSGVVDGAEVEEVGEGGAGAPPRSAVGSGSPPVSVTSSTTTSATT